jgi:hypothetical protein
MLLNETINITGIYHKTAMGPLFLQNMHPIMLLIFLAFFIILVMNLGAIRQHISGIERRTWAALLLIFLLGFALRNSGYMYGFNLDGIHYTESARTWLHTGIFMKGCAFGDIDSCSLYHQALFPAGFPFMILVLYQAFGVNSLLPMALTGILGSITILLVFFISRELFNNDGAALCGALVFALIPLDIMISGTGAVRPVSLFFTGITVFFFLHALKRDTISSWLLVSITLSLTIYMRQENSVILIPFLLLFLMRYRKPTDFIKSERFILPAALFVATQIPVQHWILFMGGLGPGIPDFSASYLPFHLPLMLMGLFFPYSGMGTFGFAATVLFLGSALFLLKGERGPAFLWVWFVSFFLLYALYFQCSSMVCGDHVRYLSSLSIPYSVLAGLSLYHIRPYLRIRMGHFLVIAALILFFTSGIPIPSSMFADARLQEPLLGDHITAISRTLPECTVITPNYMAAGSDLLGARRRWIDLEMVLVDGGRSALSEMEQAECMVLVYSSRINKSTESEQNTFIKENLVLEPYFTEGTAEVYNASLRGRP